jgi:hypothetical protein
MKTAPIHFEAGEDWNGKTFCGISRKEEPDSDTVAKNVTCHRCKVMLEKAGRPKMRVIRVFYRATFIQPVRGALNPMGLKLRTPIEVDVYESPRGCWRVRSAETGNSWDVIASQAGVEPAQKVIAAQFEKQVNGWVMYGDGGRPLKAEEVRSKDGKVYLLEGGKR